MNLHFPAEPETITSSRPDVVPSGVVLRGPVQPELLRDELLCEIFAASVAARPDRLAMASASRTLTYAEMDRQAVAIARGLRRYDIGPGKIVGLWGPRGCDVLIAQLAIAKTGAAWLPFDADTPVERIAGCLADAKAALLLTSSGFADKPRAGINCPVVDSAELIDPSDATPIDARALGAMPDDPAYLIYTSGSTGTPKGIVISNRNICHYLRAANEIYGLNATDVVFQGASIAFDLSVEEVWLPYFVGASLFVAGPDILNETERLPDMLEAHGVTVLDTVPTLLSVLPRDVESLRLVILGGEICPPSLVVRWHRPGRKIFNSYGPTEATVVATIAEVHPDHPVTIGRPIPNYTCYVVDPALALLGSGIDGELLIGGPGVAKGYLRRDALTAEKFMPNPFGGERDPVLYRSGDGVMIDSDGNLVFRGRIDDQVKIRGFRVELGEIEARLAELAGVKQAAVVSRPCEDHDELVAFIVPAPGNAVDAKLLRSALRAELPAYMVPARFERVESLPQLAGSGKVDRNRLKRLELAAMPPGELQEEPGSPTEAILFEAAKSVLPPQAIVLDADFFTELGGHSLLAARFVSLVRQTPHLSGVTLQDVYRERSIRAIASCLDRKTGVAEAPDLSFEPPPWHRRLLCGLAQFVTLPVIFSLVTAQWLGPFISYVLFTGPNATIPGELAMLVGVYASIEAALVAVGIAAKWALVGRVRPGRYPLWGFYYFRWWLVRHLLMLAPVNAFRGTPILRWYLRAIGTRIGRDVVVCDLDSGAYDLISIGDRSCIGTNANFANARVEGNELVIGSITIGADVQIGASCVIENDVTIGTGAELRDLTAIARGGKVGALEIYDGSPGRLAGHVDPLKLRPFASASSLRKSFMTMVYAILAAVIPLIGLLPVIAGLWSFDHFGELMGAVDLDRPAHLASIPVLAWPTSCIVVIGTIGIVVAFRWLVLPRATQGEYSIHSWFYVRKWAVALAVETTLETVSTLLATLYLPIWYRLMGAKIGRNTEISTGLAARYDGVEIGERCFIADDVLLGDEEIRRGYIALKKVGTGQRVFVGNSAVVPPGTEFPANVLIGVKSKPPMNAAMQEHDIWFGSPPIRLPVRQTFEMGEAALTYEPSRSRKLARAAFEGISISLPTMLFITFGTWSIEWFGGALLKGDYGGFAWRFVACSILISMALCAVVIALKWIMMGRYRPIMKPMWSWWAIRTEAMAVIYLGLAARMFLNHLRGTPFLPWVLRLFGTKIGRGTWIDMVDMTEFDCVTIGDFAALNVDSALQTHLYEDRVMKVGRIDVGRGVTVGACSTVLYDTRVSDFARLGPLTLVMKGEQIPPSSEWCGSPAEPKSG